MNISGGSEGGARKLLADEVRNSLTVGLLRYLGTGELPKRCLSLGHVTIRLKGNRCNSCTKVGGDYRTGCPTYFCFGILCYVWFRCPAMTL